VYILTTLVPLNCMLNLKTNF